MNKTKETDALLRRIHDALDAGVTPSVEDGASFEELVWSYQECASRNLAKELGLRSRVKNTDKNITRIERGQINTIKLCLLSGKPIPEKECKEFITRLSAYLSKSIPVAVLLGEKKRANRNGVPWQFRNDMKCIVDCALEEIKTRDGKRFSTFNECLGKKTNNERLGEETNIFNLLADVAEEILNNSVESKIKNYDIHEDSQIALERIMKSMSTTIDDSGVKVGLTSPNSWRDNYRKR